VLNTEYGRVAHSLPALIRRGDSAGWPVAFRNAKMRPTTDRVMPRAGMRWTNSSLPTRECAGHSRFNEWPAERQGVPPVDPAAKPVDAEHLPPV
jgi:hypothetical protein